jgi:hypothetical protein
MSTHTADPTKWSDIRTEFANGAAVSAAVAATFAVGVAADAGAGTGTGTLVGGAASCLVALGVVFGGVLVVGDPEKARPVAKGVGIAFGLAVPLAVGLAVGNDVYDRLEEEKKIMAPAPANCDRDAVRESIKDIESQGFKVTLG